MEVKLALRYGASNSAHNDKKISYKLLSISHTVGLKDA